jgi:serine/threonine protein kinase
MADNIIILPGSYLRGKFGRRYQIERQVNILNSTPDYSPTTVSPRLPRPRPVVYKAKNKSGSKHFAIKLVAEQDRQHLANEILALKRAWFVPSVPTIIENLTNDSKYNVWFFAYQWFDDRDWVPLNRIITQQPLSRFTEEKAYMYMVQLQNALKAHLWILHTLGLYHGDLKSEHILVRKNSAKKQDQLLDIDFGSLDFRKIRIIDFGFAYLRPHVFSKVRRIFPNRWQGGSVGYSNPYFWHKEHTHSIDLRSLPAIDHYGMNAILYYAFSGECFPMASPAYRSLSQPGSGGKVAAFCKSYNESIGKRVHDLHQGGHHKLGKLMKRIIMNLCAPDNF